MVININKNSFSGYTLRQYSYIEKEPSCEELKEFKFLFINSEKELNELYFQGKITEKFYIENLNAIKTINMASSEELRNIWKRIRRGALCKDYNGSDSFYTLAWNWKKIWSTAGTVLGVIGAFYVVQKSSGGPA